MAAKNKDERDGDGGVGGMDLERAGKMPSDEEIQEILKKARGDEITDEHQVDEEEEEEGRKPAKGKGKAKVEEEEEEEEGRKPAKGKGKGKTKVEEEEEEEEGRKPVKGKGKAKVEDDDDEEEEDGRKPTSAERRIKSLAARAKAAERDNEELRRQMQVFTSRLASDSDPTAGKIATINQQLDRLYVKVEEFRADNKKEEAAAAQRDIDKLNRQLAKLETEDATSKVTSRTAAAQHYNSVLDRLIANFPELNEDSRKYDEDLADELQTMIEGYTARGLSPVQALRKAAERMFKEVDPFDAEDVRDWRKEQREKGKPEKRKTDLARNADADRRQPSRTTGGRSDTDFGDLSRINVAKLTQDEFGKLPEALKSRLRGDSYTPARRRG